MFTDHLRSVLLYAILHSLFISWANAEVIRTEILAERTLPSGSITGVRPRCKVNMMLSGVKVTGFPLRQKGTSSKLSVCQIQGSEEVGQFTIAYLAKGAAQGCKAEVQVQVKGGAIVDEDIKESDISRSIGECRVEIDHSINTDNYACMLFEHDNYNGEMFPVAKNGTVNNLGDMNDKTTSVLVTEGCTLTLYKHENTIDELNSYSSDNANIGSDHHDEATSATCEC